MRRLLFLLLVIGALLLTQADEAVWPVNLPTDAVTYYNRTDAFTKEMYHELAVFKANPQQYIEYLEDYYADSLRPASHTVYVNSWIVRDNRKEVDNAISSMQSMAGDTPIWVSSQLAKGIDSGVNAVATARKLTHIYEGPGSISDRRERFVPRASMLYEVLCFGEVANPRELILLWLIDHGVPDKSHRMALMSPWKFAGFAYCEHPSQYKMVYGLWLADTY
jgi:hypothetical protein